MAENRFEVSTEGMALLHDGRPLWALVKELVANAWDEPSVTKCEVTIQPAMRGLITVTAYDNGSGFTNIEDSYTLFAPTPKQRNAEVRGRFNLGEKELISIARDATIETVGHTVVFPSSGGKKVRTNKRTSGTLITVTLKGRKSQLETTIAKLRSFLPPVGMEYVVNGERIKNRKPFCSKVAKLPTILASAPGHPIRRTERNTTMYLYTPKEGTKAQIYEMGIPIQKIAMPYDVNILQKVPMPPNRDAVSPKYLQAIFAETLVATYDRLSGDEASSAWVKTAVEDRKRTSDATVKAVMEKRYGEKVMISLPFDKDANETAFGKGYDLINSRSLSPVERERYKENGLETTAKFSLHTEEASPTELDPKKITPDMKNVGEYAQWLSEALLGFRCEIGWYKGGNKYLACFQRTTGVGPRKPMMVFNISTLRKGFFADAPTPDQTALILHELAHQNGSAERSHGNDYINTLADLAGNLYLKVSNVWKGD